MKKHSGFIVAALSHGLNDAYNGIFTPLLPLLSVNFHLTTGEVGLLSALHLMSSTLAQPFLGHLTDRYRKIPLVILGPMLTASFISLVGVVEHVLLLVLVVLLAGLSTAAFHPTAAAVVHRVNYSHKSFWMAIFTATGTLGLAIGPIIILPIVLRYGLKSSYLAAVPALLLAILLLPMSKTLGAGERPRSLTDKASNLLRSGSAMSQFAILWLTVVLRAALINVFRTFLPMLAIERDQTILFGGLSVALFLAGGTVGEVSGGYLAGRFGNKKMTVASLVGGIPTAFGFLLSDGYLALGLLFLSGLILFSSISANVVMGQHLMTGHESAAAGMMMGFAWGIGSFATALIGFLGDLTGLRTALMLSTLTLIPSAVLATLLDASCSSSLAD